MEAVIIRKAQEADRRNLSVIIAEGFAKEFSLLTKDSDKLARALCDGIRIDKFYIAQQGEWPIGAAACSDITGRAVYPLLKDLCKYFGPIKGAVGLYVMKNQFMKPLTYPSETAYLEFLTVSSQARGRGVAKQLLKGIIEGSGYRKFILDVYDVNTYAIRAYTAFGFTETHRVPAKYPKLQGYNEKISMSYTPVLHI